MSDHKYDAAQASTPAAAPISEAEAFSRWAAEEGCSTEENMQYVWSKSDARAEWLASAAATQAPSSEARDADSLRLDWLERTKRAPLNCYNMKDGFEGFTFCASCTGEKHLSLRDAIDAALTREQR